MIDSRKVGGRMGKAPPPKAADPRRRLPARAHRPIWVLACVYLRFIEDNVLCERPWLSGATQAQRNLAQDRYEQFFRARPLDSDEHYLRACFEEAARLPAMGGLFDPNHNPLWRIGATGDGAKALLDLWRAVDPDTGRVLFGFADPDLDTRFLGDLYQDLSEPVRKKYALLQTPEFVEELILDRTLTPAIREVGYREVRLIDPTRGSGHFLLGAFRPARGSSRASCRGWTSRTSSPPPGPTSPGTGRPPSSSLGATGHPRRRRCAP